MLNLRDQLAMRRFVGRDSDTFFFRIAVSDNSYSSSQSKHTCLPSLARCKWNSHALGCPQLGQSTAGAPQGSPLSGSKPNCSSTWHRSFSVATVNSHRSSVILLHFPQSVDHQLRVLTDWRRRTRIIAPEFFFTSDSNPRENVNATTSAFRPCGPRPGEVVQQSGLGVIRR